METAKLAICLIVLVLATNRCTSLAQKSRIEEFTNPAIRAARFATIAVLPNDTTGLDPGVAARVRDSLRQFGVNVAAARVTVRESEVAMQELCPKSDPPEYQGVLWVTYDRVILRDCESMAVAYRASGGDSGIDPLVKKLVSYLRTPAMQ